MNKKQITLSFDLEQVCNDVLAKCQLIATTIRDEALEDIKSNVQDPDNPETRGIICRAVTEAFGKVKVAAQRYLSKGRTIDSNILERLVKDVTYVEGPVTVRAEDSQNHPLYVGYGKISGETEYTERDMYWDLTNEVYKTSHDASSNPDTAITLQPGTNPVEKYTTTTGPTDEIATMEFETVTLMFEIPNFNTAVTDHLKSSIHKYVVDWVMARFLQDQVKDKADEYKALADGEDYSDIVKDLNARERYTMRKPNWM